MVKVLPMWTIFLDWRGVCSAPSTVTSLLKLPLITFFFIFMVFNSIIYQDKLLSVYCNPITSQFAFSSTRFVISPRSPKLCLIQQCSWNMDYANLISHFRSNPYNTQLGLNQSQLVPEAQRTQIQYKSP